MGSPGRPREWLAREGAVARTSRLIPDPAPAHAGARALVTGASGFLGRPLTAALVGAGHDVIAAGRRARPSSRTVSWTALPLEDAGALRGRIARLAPAFVFHLAVEWPVQRDRWPVMVRNLELTRNLLDACAAVEGLRRVVVVSSGAVYGECDPGEKGIHETAPLAPVGEYGLEKAWAELLSVQRAAALDLPLVRVRPFNVTGPREPARLVISAVARQIAEIERGERPPLLEVGDLGGWRDFTDVRDVAAGIALAAREAAPGDVLNVCSGESIQIRAVVDRLLEMTAERIEVAERRRPTEARQVAHQRGDPSVLARLGWRRRFTLGRSLQDVLEHWRSSPQPAQGDGPRDGLG